MKARPDGAWAYAASSIVSTSTNGMPTGSGAAEAARALATQGVVVDQGCVVVDQGCSGMERAEPGLIIDIDYAGKGHSVVTEDTGWWFVRY